MVNATPLPPSEQADFKQRVAEIAARFSNMELDATLYGGALMYMVAYYEYIHSGRLTPPTAAPPQPDDELRRLRAENAYLRDLADRAQGTGRYAAHGNRGKPRTRLATEAERQAYARGYRSGYHTAASARRKVGGDA